MEGPRDDGKVRIAFRLDRADDFLDAWAKDGPEEAQRKHGADVAEEGKPTIRDPRGFGASGAYPRIGRRINPRLIDRLYDEVGIFGTIVDEWSESTFSEGCTIQSEKNPAWAEKCNDLLQEFDILGLLEDSDRNVLTHGKGVLLWRLADVKTATTDLPTAPASGTEILEVVNVPVPFIGKAEEDKTAKAGEPNLLSLELRLRNKSMVKVHTGRLTVLREFPVLDDPIEGKPRLKRCIDSVVLYENTKWWAGESFARRASPLVQAVIDPAVRLGDDARTAIRKKLQAIIEGTTQTAVVKDYKFETVGGYSAIVNPQTQWMMAVDSVATDSRVPKHRLVGGAAGELASASTDEKRFLGRASRRQERYGTRSLTAVIEQFVDLGALEEAPADWKISWTPLDEPTILERAGAWKATGEALVQLKQAGVPYPADLLDYEAGTIPEDPNEPEEPEEPDPEEPAPPVDPGEPPAAGQKAAPTPVPGGADAPPLPEHPDLKAARLTGQQEILAAYSGWARKYQRAFDAKPDSPVAADSPLVKALNAVRVDGRSLGRAITGLLEEAGLVGGQQALGKLRSDAGAFDFQDDTPTRVFKALGDTLGDQKAQEVSTLIRSSIARGVAAGESIPQLKARVMAEFDVGPTAAEAIARTEALRGFNYGHREALRQIGATHYQLSVYGDACATCSPLEGLVFPIEDSDHVAPLHTRCRCLVVQVTTP